MLKLAQFSWNQNNMYVIELIPTYLLLLALYSLFVSKCFVHLSSRALWLSWRVKWLI